MPLQASMKYLALTRWLFPVKFLTLLLSAAFAGLAGAVQAWQFSYIDPYTMFNLGVALVPVAAALLGGSGLLLGPLVGVVLLSSLQQVLLVKLNMLQGAVYGLVIMAIGRFLPGGLLRWGFIADSKAFGWLARESHFETPDAAPGHALDPSKALVAGYDWMTAGSESARSALATSLTAANGGTTVLTPGP